MQDVEQYDGSLGPSVGFVANHQAAVGMIRWKNDLATRYTNIGNVNGDAYCTATLVGPATLVTAGHCFIPDYGTSVWPRQNGTSTPITAAQGATEMRVEFNYQLDAAGNPRTMTVSDITELVEQQPGGSDFALFTVAGTPGDTFGRTVVSPFTMKVGDEVALIQHPAGRPKQIHAGPLVTASTSVLEYSDADTLGGSSGSGILNTTTGFLQGVHTGGGCGSTGANSGIPISTIYPNSPGVRRVSFDTAKLLIVLG
jgi:V8-like Glu-specific endopeptidase